eukprot:3592894-Alexandrium_andersonii.AAC.1
MGAPDFAISRLQTLTVQHIRQTGVLRAQMHRTRRAEGLGTDVEAVSGAVGLGLRTLDAIRAFGRANCMSKRIAHEGREISNAMRARHCS